MEYHNDPGQIRISERIRENGGPVAIESAAAGLILKVNTTQFINSDLSLFWHTVQSVIAKPIYLKARN